jgi:small subunit ribosomal protein S15
VFGLFLVFRVLSSQILVHLNFNRSSANFRIDSIPAILIRRLTLDWRRTLFEMALAKQAKLGIISQYKTHDTDTGSPEVQIALLTERINELTDHFRTHGKDNHSRRGLLKLVSQRRSLLDYVKRRDINRYHDLINRLGLRK